MKSNDSKIRKINGAITKHLIDLHTKGYHYDFQILGSCSLVCLQNNEGLQISDACVRLVDQVFDQRSHSFKYIHTIDPGNGFLGLLVADGIYTNT